METTSAMAENTPPRTERRLWALHNVIARRRLELLMEENVLYWYIREV